jgi:alpha 1,2-mannosyltransferase
MIQPSYYMLFSQGVPGEGDKETFIQVAAAMGEPFYTASENLRYFASEGWRRYLRVCYGPGRPRG